MAGTEHRFTHTTAGKMQNDIQTYSQVNSFDQQGKNYNIGRQDVLSDPVPQPVQTFLSAKKHPSIKLQRASRAWEIHPILCQRNGAENCVWQTQERHFIKEFRAGTIGLHMSPALILAQLSCGGFHKAWPWGEQCYIQQGGVYPPLGGRIGIKWDPSLFRCCLLRSSSF